MHRAASCCQVAELHGRGILNSSACRTLEHAKKITFEVSRATSIALDINNSEELDRAVSQSDVVVSLIPYTLHVAVIRSAIRNRKNVVTTSYISPAMMELEEEVKAAGIVVMNEIGLDPGIDHLFAVKTIDDVHQTGVRY